MPAPLSVIPFVIVMPLDHVADPAGIITVSPELALLMALATEVRSTPAAVHVAAWDEMAKQMENANRAASKHGRDGVLA